MLASEWWNGNNPKWPPFNETSFESLADAIQQAGVTTITGGVVGDGSRYDDEFFAPTWAAADHVTQAGPIDALLANDSWQTPQVSAKDPALGAATVLRQMLVDRGIKVGQPSVGVASGGATIAEVQSQPLPAILAEMLTTSDNNTAEMVLKEIGYKAKGQGTREAGLQVVMERLAAWGVPTAGVVAGRRIRPLRRESGDVCGHPRRARTRLGHRRRRAGHAGGRSGRRHARRRVHGYPAGRKAARQDRFAQSQLQPRPARREVARRLPARSRRRRDRVRPAPERRVHRQELPLALGSTRPSAGPVPERSDGRRPSRRDESLMAVMPMFPLGSVLLPGVVLPLHVFEPRYQRLVHDCLETAEHEFGVVLIDRGTEVGGGDSRLAVGVVARMLQVAAIDEGRFAVVTVGTRRIRVTHWLPDDPVSRAPRSTTGPTPTTDVSSDRIAATAARAKRCAGLAVEMGDMSNVPEVELTGDPSFDSFGLAAISPFGPADQYAVLCAPDPLARVELIDRLLDDVEAGLQFRLG